MKSRLLIFTENYARGGGNRYMVDLVNAIQDDYESVLITSNASGIYPEDIARMKREAPVRSVGMVTRSLLSRPLIKAPKWIRHTLGGILLLLEPLFLIINICLFVWLIRKEQPTHVLSCNGGYPAAQACLAMVLAAKLTGRPTVLSIVSMPADRRRVTWIYEWLLDKLVWASTDLVIVNARIIADALCARRGAKGAAISIVYNGLEDVPLRSRTFREHGRFTMGCVARMDVAKGVLVLFESFAEMAKEDPELQLVLAGDGDAYEELSRRIRDSGLQDRVRQLGHFDGDITALLDEFDLYAFPSLWEGFPYSIVEALRAGSVIVSTNVGGIPEAITDGVEGKLVAPGINESISQAVRLLRENPELRMRLAENARKKFERDLTLSKMHQRVRAAFAGLSGKETVC